jgi:hypothetical protein
MKTINIGQEPINISTPYGDIYIECVDWQHAKPELIVSIHEVQDKADLCLTISDKDFEMPLDEKPYFRTIDTSTTKPPKSVMPPIFDVEENQN